MGSLSPSLSQESHAETWKSRCPYTSNPHWFVCFTDVGREPVLTYSQTQHTHNVLKHTHLKTRMPHFYFMHCSAGVLDSHAGLWEFSPAHLCSAQMLLLPGLCEHTRTLLTGHGGLAVVDVFFFVLFLFYLKCGHTSGWLWLLDCLCADRFYLTSGHRAATLSHTHIYTHTHTHTHTHTRILTHWKPGSKHSQTQFLLSYVEIPL